MPKELIGLICRHGETSVNKENCFRSMLDPDLNAKGLEEAHRLANVISRKYKIYKIISSPMLRAVKTADIVGEKLGLKVDQSRALFPWALGFLAGRDKDEYDNILQYYVDNPMETIPQGQSLDDFEQRIGDFFEDTLREEYSDAETGTPVGHYDTQGPYHCSSCIHKTAPNEPYCIHPEIVNSPQLETMKVMGKRVVQIDLQRGCCGYVNPSEPSESKIQLFVCHTSCIVTLENLFRGNRDGRPDAGEEAVGPGGLAEIYSTDDGYELVPVLDDEPAKFGE